MARLIPASGGRLAVALCLLAGCGVEREFWTLPRLPSNTRALIVAVELERAFRVVAFDFERGGPIELDDHPLALTVFAYQESLDELGLSAGPVAAGEVSECWSRPLALGAQIRRRALGDSEWTELSQPPSPASDFLARAKCPCPRWVEEEAFSFEFPMEGRPRFVEFDDALYFLSHLGSVRWPRGTVTASAAEVLSPNPVTAFAADLLAAPDRSIFLAVGFGIYELNLESGRVTTSTVLAVRPAGIDGGPSVDDLEIFVAGDEGRVYRRQGGVWNELSYEAGIVVADPDQNGTAFWYGPGKAVIALHDARALLSIDPSRPPQVLTRETFPSVSVFGLGVDGTTYVGSKSGPLGTFDGREITALRSFDPRLEGAGEVRRVFPVGRGMGFVAQVGYVGEVAAGAGVCPLQETRGFRDLFDGVGNEVETIVAGRDPGGRLRVARYRRRLD